MNAAPQALVVRLVLLGLVLLVLVGVLSCSSAGLCVVAAVVLGLAAATAGVLGALATGRR